MIRLARRGVLQGAVLGSAAVLAPGMACALDHGRALVVFDSRLPESARFAADHLGALTFDLAEAGASRWSALRGELPQVRVIEGLSGWSDWVSARGLLEGKGLRLLREDRIAAPLSGKAGLFRWSMARPAVRPR